MAKQFTLGKSERLKSRKAIELLFKEGKRFTIAPYRIFYTHSLENELRMGVAVGTKNFKKAVDRNRIKRLTREAWRLQKNQLAEIVKQKESGLHVFFIYTEKQLPVYKEVVESVRKIIGKLSKQLEK
jgi:ribonuclease P protein component